MIAHTIASVPVEDDIPFPVASDDSDEGSDYSRHNPEPKRRSTVPAFPNTVSVETIPDFHTQAINY